MESVLTKKLGRATINGAVICPPRKNLPWSYSFAESTVLRLKVNCRTFFVVILNGICLLDLNIRVNTLRENYSCNYKHYKLN